MLKNCLKPRQHLHMVARLVNDVHLLGSFDISSLFYSLTEAALKVETKEKAKKTNGRRRVPSGSGKTELHGPEGYGIEPLLGAFVDSGMKFQPFRSPMAPYSFRLFDVFAPFSSSKILCADPAGHAIVYDLESRTILGMPKMNSSKGPTCLPISIPRTVAHRASPLDMDSAVFGHETYGYDRLYMLDMIPNSAFCFEVLAYYPELLQWCWRSLPAPPFDLRRESPEIPTFAVINAGTSICLSSANATYLFDTVGEEWSKVGDWVLPFLSKAEYDPELGVWLGLSAQRPYSLCTFDLSNIAALGSCDEPPATLDIGLDIDPPEDWELVDLCLTNLRSGRFCISKFFSCNYEEDMYRPVDVIFTGVEVVPFVGHQGERTLRMIKHRSKHIIDGGIELLF